MDGDKNGLSPLAVMGGAIVLVAFAMVLTIKKPGSTGQTTTSIFSSAPSGKEFEGRWSHPQRDEITGHPYTQFVDISRNGSSFLLTFHGTYFKARQGTFPATYDDGTLHAGPFGDVVLNQQSNLLYMAGETFGRDSL